MDESELERVARRVLRGECAEDVEDALVELKRRWHAYGRTENLRWIRLAARSAFQDARLRRRADSMGLDLDRAAEDAGFSAVEFALDVRRAWSELGAEHRAAIRASLSHGSLAEAAESLGLGLGAYKSRLRKARRLLRGLMER